MNKPVKYNKATVIVFVVIFLATYFICFFISPENNIFYAKAYEKQNNFHAGNIVNEIEQGSKAWSYRITRQINLKQGDYKINIGYSTDEDTPVSLKLTSEYDAETGTYPVINLGILEKGENLTKQFDVHVPKDAYMAIIYFDYAGYGEAVMHDVEIIGDQEVFINKQIVALIVAFIVAFVCAVAVNICNNCKENKKEKLFILLMLFVIVIVSSWFYFANNSLDGDDTYFHISRIWGHSRQHNEGCAFL